LSISSRIRKSLVCAEERAKRRNRARWRIKLDE
jgi:hypothetical protein